MMNVNKRFAKTMSGFLAAVMITFALAPTAAFAAHHHHQPPRPQPPHHHSHHHPHGHDKWTKHDSAALAGVAAVIGLLALANKQQRESTPPADPMSYAEYRDKFASGLNYSDQYVYNKLISYPAGEYKTPYTKPETLKMMQKFCKKLPYDFQFVGTRVVRLEDGSIKNYIYFNPLESAEFDDTDVSTVAAEL